MSVQELQPITQWTALFAQDSVLPLLMNGPLVGRGITAPPTTDWEALQSLKNQFLEGRSEADVHQWQKKGVTTFHGKAVMTGTDTIKVNDTNLDADHIVLATGA